MPLTKIYKKVKRSVVRVIALQGTSLISFGSGSVIGTGKHVLTCEHCIIPGLQMAIIDPTEPERAIKGNVVFSDKSLDIAILEFQDSVGDPAVLSNSSKCEIGNGGFVVGFPMGIQEQTLMSAHVASVTPSGLRIDVSVNHGNSGGPFFNLKGEQVGVVNAKHGTLSTFLQQMKTETMGAQMRVGGFDAVQSIRTLIVEMEKNLNLGIGYAIPTDKIRKTHPLLEAAIPAAG